MNLQKRFGRRVRAARKAANLTREKAVEKAGLSGANYLGEIERGEKWPAPEKIEALARAFGVAPASFFQFDRDETDPKLLRKRIDSLLEKCSPQQLQLANRLLKSLLEQ
ncbi:MAG: helix-turn-helix domain-containing protein [Acidobacteria bacterium]|nr:helix-turn-helix domain-containing protein [Acidobacteriota bacterium]